MNKPLVSLILCVKNGLPYLREAVASVEQQTYRNLELIVQDAASTDGSLEFLESVDTLSRVEIVSEPDEGIGDAYNRAVRRCSGDLVGTIDSDNLLDPTAVETAVTFMSERPELAAAYGGSNMISADGELLYPWMPDAFDLLKLLECELVPPFAVTFFSHAGCGDDLRFEESMRTCADFDMWLRLSDRPIARIPQVLGSTRLSPASMTRRPETYEQYIEDKLGALERYLDRFGRNAVLDAVRARSVAGLYLWAAESVYDIEKRRTEQFDRYLGLALEHDPTSDRAARLQEKPEIDPSTLEPEVDAGEPEPVPEAPPPESPRLAAALERLLRR